MPQPRVFVIGDSISIRYGPDLERMLRGVIAYARKSGEEEALLDLDNPQGANGGDSSMVLEYLEALRRTDEPDADWVVINCGLHDVKTDPQTQDRQVSLEDYRSNLKRIADLVADSGARLVWVRTTGVDDERHNRLQTTFLRYDADVLAYNAVADEIMAGRGASIVDLNGFTASLEGEVYCDHVHFTEEVCRLQAAFLAGALRAIAGV
jgi:lysophospholipase L1-like esterase